MKSILRQIVSYIELFVLLIVIGLAALLLVYRIPTEGRMRDHLEASIPIFEEEGDHPMWGGMKDGHAHYMGTVAENFTDAIMLSMADYSGENGTVNEALLARYYQGSDVADSLKRTVGEEKTENAVAAVAPKGADAPTSGSEVSDSVMEQDESKSDVQLLSYGRFWNGYMVWLKPLLYLTDYGTMRMIGMILCLAAVVFLCIVTQNVLGTPYTVGMAVTLAVLNPVTISTCISYWPEFYILVIACTVLMKRWRQLKEKGRTGLLFAATGSACAYWCWLFYPLVTVGILLSLFCVMEIRDLRMDQAKDGNDLQNRTSKEESRDAAGPEKAMTPGAVNGHFTLHLVLRVIGYGIVWMIFYLGTWAAKWLIATGVTGTNVLLDAENQVALRTSTTHENGMKLTAFHTIYNNVAVLAKAPYILLFALCFLWLVVYMIRHGRDELQQTAMARNLPKQVDGHSAVSGKNVEAGTEGKAAGANAGHMGPTGICYILIALIPFAWYALTVNHSYIHVIIVYRDLAIAVFAVCCWLVHVGTRLQDRKPAAK